VSRFPEIENRSENFTMNFQKNSDLKKKIYIYFFSKKKDFTNVDIERKSQKD